MRLTGIPRLRLPLAIAAAVPSRPHGLLRLCRAARRTGRTHPSPGPAHLLPRAG